MWCGQVRGAAADAGGAGGARGRRGAHQPAARARRARAVPRRQVLGAHPHAALRQVHEVAPRPTTLLFETQMSPCSFIFLY